MKLQAMGGAGSLSDYLPQIEAELEEIVRTADESQVEYYGMMRYHLGWVDETLSPLPAAVGKRLRPLLCVLCCEAMGEVPWRAMPAAAAVELVHSFSLVHDDIQDHSRVRRGRRAVWDLWGSAHGINVGDGLFVLARLALHRLVDRGLPPARQQTAVRALDRACLALCEGQFLDLTFEERDEVSLAEYYSMIRLKTAALLAASAQLGAIAATDDIHAANACYRFGESLGIAYQIRDDILGIWGDEKMTGKSAATDIRDKKKTLPIIYALQETGDTSIGRELASLYSHSAPLSSSAIQQVLAVLDQAGARHYAEGMAEEHTRHALEHLDRLGLDSGARSSLQALVSALQSREA